MKKIIIFCAVVSVIIGSMFIIKENNVPASSKMSRQIHDKIKEINRPLFAADDVYRLKISSEINQLKFALGLEYNEEKKPDKAIEVFEDLIRENKEQYISGKRMPKNSGQFGLDSAYFKALAAAYDMKADHTRKHAALKRAEAAQRQSVKLKKNEAVEILKGRDSLLN
jgi:predicted Zn-dependent protease